MEACRAYAAEHRLPALLEAMAAHLLHDKPADPVAALVAILQRLQAGGDAALPGTADCEACFDGLEDAGTGFVTLDQATKGLELLGADAEAAASLAQLFPGEVCKNAFVMYAREVLQQRWGVQELAGEEAPAPELAD